MSSSETNDIPLEEVNDTDEDQYKTIDPPLHEFILKECENI